MDCMHLYDCILCAYKEYEIHSFPIDCFEIIKKHKIRVVKYSELDDEKRKACHDLSGDACLINNTLYYDETAHSRRITFSIAHELGHYFLVTDDEDESDEFASHFLAPRILIHKYGYRNADQIHDAFGLSYAASNRALTSYKKWFDEISHSVPREPSQPELELEEIFFPSTKLVQNIKNDDDYETDFDPLDKYLYVLRVLKAGLPLPAEYRGAAERYHRMRLKSV